MSIGQRLYCDYLQRERLDELEALLRYALARRYGTMTLSAFAEIASTAQCPDRVLLLRHDIDSDVPRARRMWDIERRLGLVGSYFFRRSTWDLRFMRELHTAGCDVGYHYEELADVTKERGAATPDEARALFDLARARLRVRVEQLRVESGLPLEVLAAHGDFANRAVGVSNVELLWDTAVRRQIGVRLEAYDVEDAMSARSTDGVNPRWSPEDPADALDRGEPVVGVLVHPRSWGAAPLVNARADVRRMAEGCLYRVRRVSRKAGLLDNERAYAAR